MLCSCPARSSSVGASSSRPDPSEGFLHIEVLPFVRPRELDFVNRAVIVSCDDVEDLVRLASPLHEFRDAGYRLLGISWKPEIAAGKRSEEFVKAMFARECERLGLDVDVEYCPHEAGPPRCWCRKPLPRAGCGLHQTLPARSRPMSLHRHRPSRCDLRSTSRIHVISGLMATRHATDRIILSQVRGR